MTSVAAMPGNRLPHARGGVSNAVRRGLCDQKSSPRSWGCFSPMTALGEYEEVFPTLVGVFLSLPFLAPVMVGLPHARGGVSSNSFFLVTSVMFSPRSWGCFHSVGALLHDGGVFPTLVGVFPLGVFYGLSSSRLPHARGGVSVPGAFSTASGRSSPRSWGCFPLTDLEVLLRSVFPTLVGVFPSIWWRACSSCRLPHARGGVSIPTILHPPDALSSPRSWGCFLCPSHV